MKDHNPINIGNLGNCRLKLLPRVLRWLLVIAVVGAAAALVNGVFVKDPVSRFLNAWLVAFTFVLSISLGSMFFVLVQHLTRAGWGVVVRRMAEIVCVNFFFVAILFLPIAWSVWHGDGALYVWSSDAIQNSSRHDGVNAQTQVLVSPVKYVMSVRKSNAIGESADHAQQSIHANQSSVEAIKIPLGSESTVEHLEIDHRAESHLEWHGTAKPWLNRSRFLWTWLWLFAIWIGLAIYYFHQSVGQDKTGDVSHTRKMEWWSGLATIVFGFSVTICAFDLLM